MEHPTDDQEYDTKRAHLTASKNLNHGSETMPEASEVSSRESIADKAYGINAKESSIDRSLRV